MALVRRRPEIKQVSLSQDQGWPEVLGSLKTFDAPASGLVGMDLEYKINAKPYEPYLASLAYRPTDSTLKAVAVPYKRVENLLKLMFENPRIAFVGHNVLSADCEVLRAWWGENPAIPEGGVIDTLLAYFLMNQHLLHAAKEIDDVTGQVEYERGPGKLNLGSMVSQYLDWANYKKCRGPEICHGPCPKHDEAAYNALDGAAPIVCWEIMEAEARDYPSDYYPEGVPLARNLQHLVELQHVLNHMPPIPVHMPTVAQLNADLEAKKAEILPSQEIPRYHKRTGAKLSSTEIEWDYGFNPASPKQVKEFFAARNIRLPKSSLEDINYALRDLPKNVDPLTVEALERLRDYKKYGKGYKSWYGEEVLQSFETPPLNAIELAADDDPAEWQYLAPEWSTYGGAMGRPVTSKPNCQNFPKRGFMKAMRKALRAPKGYKYLKFDAQQGELRVFGMIGGIDPMDMGEDAFTWVVQECDGLFESVAAEAATEYNRVPRNACKQMVHAYDYGEGLQLFAPGSWERGKLGTLYDSGALLIYEDWEYNGRIVGFNGINLAERLFGSASVANRRKALKAQATFAKLIPAAQRAQKRIMRDSLKGYVVTPSGHLLKLYNDERENIKQALAMNGQCTLSAYMQETIKIYAELPYKPVIFIHDEIGMLVPEHWTRKQCADYIADGSHESKLIPGFRCPVDMEWGPSYGELTEPQ